MSPSIGFFQKIFSQKGQGFVEYALLFGFVGAIFLFVFAKGGFGNAIESVFGSANENMETAGSSFFESTDSDGDTSADASSGTSSDTSTQSGEKAASPTFKSLNWQRDIIPFVDRTYDTIAGSDTVDKALSSEIGFFNTLFAATEGYLASTNAADGTKDWESFLGIIDSTRAQRNFQSSYTRGEQKITVKRIGNDLRITYSGEEGTHYYYKLSPDANNVMQVETNSNKTYGQFFSSVMSNADGGGWQYSN